MPSLHCCAQRLLHIFLLLLSGAVAIAGESQQHDLVVATTAGKIRGTAGAAGGARFLGIPFAEPPVGSLRWHPPVEPQAWVGIRDATTFGAPCAQAVSGEWNRTAAENGVEDCLYLNVISGQWPARKRLPVMVWIHGGGNSGGTASGEFYNDGTLTRQGVVLVTLNYRLGVFGFFAHPELTRESPQHASGNYALMDQIAALKWVQQNIAAFGGDPQNVTVFGQSAGALNVGLLMTSPLARGLFQRAIAQSGSVLFDPEGTPLTKMERAGESLAALLGVSGDGAIPALRKRSAAELLSAIAHPRTGSGDSLGFNPTIDGWVIPRRPIEVFAAGEAAPVPFMLGYNARELEFPAPADEQRKRVAEVFGPFATQAWKLYGLADGGEGASDALYGTLSNQITSDMYFRCPAALIASWQVRAHQRAYLYQFERAIPGQENVGAVHSAELPYVFGSFPKTGNLAGRFTKVDFALADELQGYWAQFAHSGNPNRVGAPHWPEVGQSAELIRFTVDARVQPESGGVRGAFCSLYNQAIEERLKHH